MKIDPIHQQRQREFILALLMAYGISGKHLDALDNGELKKLLEKALCGIKQNALYEHS